MFFSKKETVKPLANVLSDFRLEDQWGRLHESLELIHKMPLILIASDRRHSEPLLNTWENELKKALFTNATILGLVDLHRLPFFIPKGTVKSFLQKNCPKVQVLCDWDGKVYQALGLPKDEMSVSIYFSDGKLMERILGEFAPHKFQQLHSVINSVE